MLIEIVSIFERKNSQNKILKDVRCSLQIHELSFILIQHEQFFCSQPTTWKDSQNESKYTNLKRFVSRPSTIFHWVLFLIFHGNSSEAMLERSKLLQSNSCSSRAAKAKASAQQRRQQKQHWRNKRTLHQRRQQQKQLQRSNTAAVQHAAEQQKQQQRQTSSTSRGANSAELKQKQQQTEQKQPQLRKQRGAAGQRQSEEQQDNDRNIQFLKTEQPILRRDALKHKDTHTLNWTLWTCFSHPF